MPFTFEETALRGVILVKARIFGDDRGFFLEAYKWSEFQAGGISAPFVQDNRSRSTYGVLRGLHYQVDPMAQGKLVSVVRGQIFDVAVDIRKGSPTFGQWVGVTLSDENQHMLYVPPGFAHGFCVTSGVADVAYKVTAEYAPACERGIIWNDPTINVDWPVSSPVLSGKDQVYPSLSDADIPFIYTGESAF